MRNGIREREGENVLCIGDGWVRAQELKEIHHNLFPIALAEGDSNNNTIALLNSSTKAGYLFVIVFVSVSMCLSVSVSVWLCGCVTRNHKKQHEEVLVME